MEIIIPITLHSNTSDVTLLSNPSSVTLHNNPNKEY